MKIHSVSVAFMCLVLLGAGCTGGGAPSSTADELNIGEAKATGGNVLDLSGDGLEAVPSYVFRMVKLEELDLSDNRLTGALPGEIRFLTNLERLDASGNLMTGVPAEIGQLSQLRELDLSDNGLTGLPNELGNLRNLQRLDLRGNDVSRMDLEGIRTKLVNTEILE